MTTPCRCPYIRLGSETTTSRNWNPDCPEHGQGTPWHAEAKIRWAERAAQTRQLLDEARRRRNA